MEVWVVKWDYPYDMDNNITVWVDELSALQAACKEIKRKIDSDWDMDDSDQEEAAKLFDSQIAAGTVDGLRNAMKTWNDYQDNFNDENGEWYFVWSETVHGAPDIQANIQQTTPVAYKASVAGATCRGPCKQHNPYAYADKPDGTHLCHQCSTFQSIFGVKS